MFKAFASIVPEIVDYINSLNNRYVVKEEI